ncbi:MAG: hypothetical protein ACXWNJ_05765 [Vulcanimicrobiaceae bacterium]
MQSESEQKTPQAASTEQPRPTMTFTHVIATVNTGTFGGWGPKVAGPASIIKSWN